MKIFIFLSSFFVFLSFETFISQKAYGNTVYNGGTININTVITSSNFTLNGANGVAGAAGGAGTNGQNATGESSGGGGNGGAGGLGGVARAGLADGIFGWSNGGSGGAGGNGYGGGGGGGGFYFAYEQRYGSNGSNKRTVETRGLGGVGGGGGSGGGSGASGGQGAIGGVYIFSGAGVRFDNVLNMSNNKVKGGSGAAGGVAGATAGSRGTTGNITGATNGSVGGAGTAGGAGSSAGGAIAAYNTNFLMLSDIIFNNNTAIGGYGGAIAMSGGKMTLQANGNFANNSAASGGVYAINSAQLDFQSGIVFTNNTAVGGTTGSKSGWGSGGNGGNGGNGGAGGRGGDAVNNANVLGGVGGAQQTNGTRGNYYFRDISDRVTANNNGSLGGAAGSTNGSSGQAGTAGGSGLPNTTGVSISGYGGAIFAVGNSEVKISGNALFERNSATWGAAIYLWNSSLINNSNNNITIRFNSNTASDSGVIEINNGIIDISGANTKVYFSENKTTNPLIRAAANSQISFTNDLLEFNKNIVPNGRLFEFMSPAGSPFLNIDVKTLNIINNTSGHGLLFQHTLGGNSILLSIEADRVNISGNKSDKRVLFDLVGVDLTFNAAGEIKDNIGPYAGTAFRISDGQLTLKNDKGAALIFQNNKRADSNALTDIHLELGGNLYIDNTSPILIKGGLSSGLGTKIVKDGTGTFSLSGIGSLSATTLEIKKGTFLNDRGANQSISIGKLDISGAGGAAKYSTKNNVINGSVISSITVAGTVEIDADFAKGIADFLTISGSAEIKNGSILNINALSMGGAGDRVLFIKPNGSLIYTNGYLTLTNPVHYSLQYISGEKAIYIVKNRIGPWNDFAFLYKENELERIALTMDIKASTETTPADMGKSSNKTFIINGNNYFLDSLGYNNLGFIVSDGQKADFSNITLKNFSASANIAASPEFDGSGGALKIKNNSSVEILAANKNLSFVGNKASQHGGAIYIKDASFHMKSNYSTLTFLNNSAYSGAAIFAENGIIDIDGVSEILFQGNSALVAGGGILRSSDSKISVSGANTNVYFNENKALDGILKSEHGSQISFTNNLLEFNKNIVTGDFEILRFAAQRGSPSLNIDVKTLKIENNTGGYGFLRQASNLTNMSIQADSVNISANSAMGRAGALFNLNGGNLTFNAAGIIKDNTANNLGGAVYIQNGTLFLKNNKPGELVFKNNMSPNTLNDFYLDIDSVLFIDNASPISIKSGILGVENSEIIKTGTGTLTLEGNIDYAGSFDIRKGIVLNNMPENSLLNINNLILSGSGGVSKYSTKNNVINGTKVSNIIAAGTLEIDADFENGIADFWTINGNAEIQNGSILNINAISMGGAGDRVLFIKPNGSLIYTDGYLTLSDRIHYSLQYEQGENAIYIVKNPIGHWNDFAFLYKENEFGRSGLTMDIKASSEIVPSDMGRTQNKTFVINGNSHSVDSANYDNLGFIVSDGQTADISNASLKNFTASAVLGNVDLDGSGAALKIKNNAKAESFTSGKTLTFAGNIAQSSGGAIHIKDGSFAQRGAYSILIFENNSAKSGGALAVEDGSFEASGNQGNVLFKENTAQRGAAISAKNGVLKFSKNSVGFYSNNSQNGNGIIELLGNSVLSFPNSIVSAKNNQAKNGGFLSLNNLNKTMEIEADAFILQENKATGTGGALNIENAAIIISGKIEADGNRALKEGGAVYLKNAVLEFNSAGHSIFANNISNNVSADAKGNDFYLDNNSEVYFNAQSGAIELRSGIAGVENSFISKTGAKDLILSGNIDFKGKTSVEEGLLKINAVSAQFGAVSINEDASFATLPDNTSSFDALSVFGKYGEFVDIKADKANQSNSASEIIIGEKSVFGLTLLNLPKEKKTYRIMSAQNIDGRFGILENIYPPNVRYALDYQDTYINLIISPYQIPNFALSHNKEQIKNYFEKSVDAWDFASPDMKELINAAYQSDTQSAQEEFFGKFNADIIANALKSAADNKNSAIAFDRLRPDLFSYENNQSFWLKGTFYHKKTDKDENSNGDFLYDEYSALLGTDIMQSRKMLIGGYAEIMQADLKEGKDSGNTKGIGLGLYLFAPLNNTRQFNIKSALSFEYQDFNIKREIELNGNKYQPESAFNTKAIKAAIEIEKIFTIASFNITPFIGIQGGFAFNNAFEEQSNSPINLSIQSGSNNSISAPFGISADYKINKVWTARAKIIGKTILSGASGEFSADVKEMPIKDLKLKGTQENLAYGAQIGIDYNISPLFALTADANLANSEYSFGLGVVYKVGGKQPAETVENKGAEKENGKAVIAGYNKGAEKKIEKEEKTQESAVDEAEKKENEKEELRVLVAIREERNKKAVEKITLGAANFLTGKSDLTRKAKEKLRHQIEKLNSLQYAKIVIEGHTDARGSDDFNNKLSQDRAQSVYKEFASAGIALEKMECIGYGSKIPVSDNKTYKGREANRRIEVWALTE